MDILVVEGVHDYAKLKDVFKGLIITTNGSEIKPEILELLKKYSQDNRIIIFTDPDYPGERIRRKIEENCQNVYHIFIDKKKCISKNKKKVGVEHADIIDIKEALKQIYFEDNSNDFWNLSRLTDLKLTSYPKSRDLRKYLCQKLSIGQPNTKTLINRLNNFNISYDKVKEILDEYPS